MPNGGSEGEGGPAGPEVGPEAGPGPEETGKGQEKPAWTQEDADKVDRIADEERKRLKQEGKVEEDRKDRGEEEE